MKHVKRYNESQKFSDGISFNIIPDPEELLVGQIWYGKSENDKKKHFVEITEIDEENLIIKWKRALDDGSNKTKFSGREGLLDILEVDTCCSN